MVKKRKKSNHFKYILLLFAIFSVAFIIFVFLYINLYTHNKGNKLNFTSGDLRSKNIVELRDKGFFPEKLSIKKGETVTFINKRNKSFWPASNIHPQHSIYPEFDPKRPIEPNQIWNFTFDRVGKWRYHDHTASYYRGVIIVSGKDQNTSLLDPCQTNQKDSSVLKMQCWSDQVENVLNNQGLDAALTMVATLYESQPDFAANCHEFLHKIGQIAYIMLSDGKPLKFTTKITYCSYGFFHGFMDSLMQKTGNLKEAMKFCDNTEVDLKDKASMSLGNCFHGIGHGLVDVHNTNFTGNGQAMVEKALKICEEFTGERLKGKQQVDSCFSGVFTEISMSMGNNENGLVYNREDPLGFCHKQQKKYKASCYSALVKSIGWLMVTDFPKAAKLIESIEDIDSAKEAMKAFTSLIILDLPKYDLGKSIIYCHSLNSELRLSCISGLSFGFVAFGKPEKEYVEALNFCHNKQLLEEEKQLCLKEVLINLKGIYPQEKIELVCNYIKEKYNERCIY